MTENKLVDRQGGGGDDGGCYIPKQTGNVTSGNLSYFAIIWPKIILIIVLTRNDVIPNIPRLCHAPLIAEFNKRGRKKRPTPFGQISIKNSY